MLRFGIAQDTAVTLPYVQQTVSAIDKVTGGKKSKKTSLLNSIEPIVKFICSSVWMDLLTHPLSFSYKVSSVFFWQQVNSCVLSFFFLLFFMHLIDAFIQIVFLHHFPFIYLLTFDPYGSALLEKELLNNCSYLTCTTGYIRTHTSSIRRRVQGSVTFYLVTFPNKTISLLSRKLQLALNL